MSGWRSGRLHAIELPNCSIRTRRTCRRFQMPAASKLCVTQSYIIDGSESIALVVWSSILNGLKFPLLTPSQLSPSGQTGWHPNHIKRLSWDPGQYGTWKLRKRKDLMISEHFWKIHPLQCRSVKNWAEGKQSVLLVPTRTRFRSEIEGGMLQLRLKLSEVCILKRSGIVLHWHS